jgi:carbonic anhydrase
MKKSFEHYVATQLKDLAAQEKPRILLLTCIDYRYAHRITSVMDSMNLTRKYDMFALAGAAAGANENRVWRQVLVEHIRVARDPQIGHPIDRIIILEHRDCGAYKKFFGLEWDQVTPPVEEACHEREVGKLITDLKREFATDIPNLVIDSLLLARDEDDVLVEAQHR